MGEMTPPGFHRSVRDPPEVPAPDRAVWITTPLELVEGEETTPFVRASAVSDLTFAMAGRTMEGGFEGLAARGAWHADQHRHDDVLRADARRLVVRAAPRR